MTKKKKTDRMVVEPTGKGVAYFSYDNIGLAVTIGDHDIDTVFDIAKTAIKKQMENQDEHEEGEEVRSEEERLDSDPAEPVDGDTSTGGVSSEVHGPDESDVR